MNIDYSLIVLVLWLFFALSNRNSQKEKKWVAVFLCLIFIIEAGFRDFMHTSNDTWNYWHGYENLQAESLGNVLSSFSLTYKNYEDRDPGFTIFTKLFQLTGGDFRMFLIFVASIISIPLCRLLYKYVPTVNGLFMSAMIYQALFAGFFNTGMRQTVALGICLWSLIYYERQKPLQHYLLIFIAFTIHTTAFLFVPLYLIRKIDAKMVIRGALLVTPLTMLNARAIIAFLGSGTIFESYAVNSTDNLGTPVFTAMIAFITIAVAMNYDRIVSYFKDSMFLVQAMAIALMLTPASWVDSNFLRITYYYLIFMLPLFPMMIEAVTVKNSSYHKLAYIGSTAALLFLMYH